VIRRPLDFLPSIKLKLGAIIVGSVFVAVLVISLGVKYDVWPYLTVALAGVLSLVMVQVLARGMVSPLREMSKAAAAMSRGDYNRRVTATSNDEVGDLARAFNAMAAQLAEVDRIRRDLVANVSHELRTPITALRAGLENLVDGVEPTDPATFRTMLGQVERLGRLVSQLLDLSKLESGTVPLNRQRFRVRPLLDQAVREARLHAPETMELVVDADDELEANADPERVHQVVANILENAVRHSPTDGRVLVGARGDNGALFIEVTDQGPGVPRGAEERIFERFYRADAARTRSEGGTGLGLAIARWIVDMHGGVIRADRAEPTGCRMVVSLPNRGAPPDPRARAA
jgi:signal transduction histidine kinase